MRSERFQASQQEQSRLFEIVSVIALSLPRSVSFLFSHSARACHSPAPQISIPREENAYLPGIFINHKTPSRPSATCFELGTSKEGVYASRKRSSRIWKLDLRSRVCVTRLYGTAHVAFRFRHHYCITTKPLLRVDFPLGHLLIQRDKIS